MRRFIIYIAGGLIAILTMMAVLDIVYTKIYEIAYPRTKFQYFRSLKNQKVDYIFLGSSRVENGIIPSIVKMKTGKHAVNFGFQAATLGDIYTLLKLVKEYNIRSEMILIQVDYIYNNKSGHSNIFEFEVTPFIRDNEVTKSYCYNYTDYPIANYYLPFYRYCNNDLKIGFRELFANCIRKKNNVFTDSGYGPKYGTAINMTGILPAVILDKNPIMDSIQTFMRQNKMKAVFYCAPFCKNNQNQDYTAELKARIPGFKDFSRIITDDRLFLNCNHLNDSGAKQFTEIFTKKVLLLNNEKLKKK